MNQSSEEEIQARDEEEEPFDEEDQDYEGDLQAQDDDGRQSGIYFSQQVFLQRGKQRSRRW